MTEVGFIIQPGESIPEDVIGVRDRADDDWVPTERGHWHMLGNVRRCHGDDADGYSFMLEFAPLTVTAVREQPAEPERDDEPGNVLRAIAELAVLRGLLNKRLVDLEIGVILRTIDEIRALLAVEALKQTPQVFDDKDSTR